MDDSLICGKLIVMPANRRILVLPEPVVRSALSDPITSDLLVTDIGYYPQADWHYTLRQRGAAQMVIMYCVAGKGWVRTGRGRSVVSAGQAVILPPHREHEYASHDDAPWTIYWLHVAGTKVDALYRLLTDEGAETVIELGEDPDWIALFEQVYHTMRQSYGPDHLLLASLSAGRLLARMIELRRRQPPSQDARQRINLTIRYMQQRLGARVSVPELCRLANLSASHYAAAFKQQTGYAVIDFFLRLKMQRAAVLLDTTDRPIKTVAAELGFDDPLYFSRQFRRIYNVPPRKYRAIKKG
jgi:AraC-like DNA-binding protein